MLNRRSLLAAVAALALGPRAALASGDPLVRDAVRALILFGLPLLEMARARQAALAAGQRINELVHRDTLVDARFRDVTTPNVDTLYSTAWLDLRRGPVQVAVPPEGGRYRSVALLDMYTDNAAVLGRRTLGPEGGEVTVVGPADPLPHPQALRISTAEAWLLARVFVRDASDLAGARQVQSALGLRAPQAPPLAIPVPGREAGPGEIVDAILALMEANPPRITDQAVLRRLAPLSSPGAGRRRDGAAGAAIAAGAADAVAALRDTALGWGPVIDRWVYTRPDIGRFAEDYLYRAQVAVGGLGALPRAEAMYMRALAPDGGFLFDGRQRWRLTFPAGALPPVDGFWSLTLYEPTADGRFFLFDHPSARHMLSDRSRGVEPGPGGELELLIGGRPPAQAEPRWLPAPEGPFALFFRAYLPRTDLLDGRWTIPPVQPG